MRIKAERQGCAAGNQSIGRLMVRNPIPPARGGGCRAWRSPCTRHCDGGEAMVISGIPDNIQHIASRDREGPSSVTRHVGSMTLKQPLIGWAHLCHNVVVGILRG